jgi:hypothetical protein
MPRTVGSANKPIDPKVAEAAFGPLDWAIFERLPDEGSVLGYHQLFKSAKQVLKELNADVEDGAPKLSMPELSTRMRVLRLSGHLVAVTNLAGGVAGWQRSRRAMVLLERRDRHQHDRGNV